MANVATLTAKMAMDVSGFSGGANKVIGDLGRIKNSTSSAASGMSSLATSMAAGGVAGVALAVAFKGISVAATGVQSAIKGIASEVQHGFGLAMAAESAETRFRVLTKSAEQAKKIMSDVNSFTLATPFSTEATLGGVKALMGAGVEQSRLFSTMRMLGEISGGNMETFSGLATVYGQVTAKGKLLSQDFNQIAERGINMRKALATELHVGLADVSKMMEAGKISAVTFHNALHRLATEDFKGGLQAASKDMQGVVDRLGEIRDSFSRNVAGGLGGKLGLKDMGNDFADLAEGLSNTFAPAIVNSFDSIGSAAFDMIDTFRILKRLAIDPMKLAQGPGAAFKEMTKNWTPNLVNELAGIDTRRDVGNARAAMQFAGRAFSANKPGLAESQGMTKNSFTDLGKGIGDGVANGLLGGLMKAGGNIGAVGMAGAKGLASSLLTTSPKPAEQQHATGALVAGSQEAFSAIIRAMTGRDAGKPAERTAKATEEMSRKLDRMTKDLVDAIKGQITGVLGSLSG